MLMLWSEEFSTKQRDPFAKETLTSLSARHERRGREISPDDLPRETLRSDINRKVEKKKKTDKKGYIEMLYWLHSILPREK